MMLPKHKPARDAKYLAWIRQQPCCICHPGWWYHARFDQVFVPVAGGQAHHPVNAGMGRKCSDYLAVPMCQDHHQEIESPGSSKKAVEARYKIDFLKTGYFWRETFFSGKTQGM